MRPTRWLACGLLLAFAIAPLVAEETPKPVPEAPKFTAEQVLDKSLEAQGGKEAFARIRTMTSKIQMKMPAQGMQMKTEMILKVPDLFYSLTEIPGVMKQEMGYDGKDAWARDAVTGLRPLTEDQMAEHKRGALSAWDWRTVYKKVELRGREEITPAGAQVPRQAFVVVLTPEKGRPVTRWFDAETFLLLREEVESVSPQGKMKAVTDMGDYRRVEGILRPFEVHVTAMGMRMEARVLEMTCNERVDERKFSRPRGEEATPDEAPVPEP